MTEEEFISCLTAQIRHPKARDPIAREIRMHLEEQKEDYIASGMLSKEAEELAVQDMGDPVEIGQQMDAIHRPRLPLGMMVSIILLTSIYIVMRERMIPMRLTQEWIGLFIGSVCMIVICLLDYTWIAEHAKKLTLMITVLMSVSLYYASFTAGQRKWLYLGSVRWNITMFCLMLVPLFSCILFQERQKDNSLIKCLFWMLPSLALPLLVPSYEQFFLVLGTEATVIAYGIRRGWFKKDGLALLVACLLIGIAIGTKLLQRFPAMIGTNVPMTDGSMIGTWFPGIQFMLAALWNHDGLFASLLTITPAILILVWFLKEYQRQHSELGKMIGLSCLVGMLSELLLYLMANLGWVTIDLEFCPFFGTGASGIALMMIRFGLLLSVHRYQKVFE